MAGITNVRPIIVLIRPKNQATASAASDERIRVSAFICCRSAIGERETTRLETTTGAALGEFRPMEFEILSLVMEIGRCEADAKNLGVAGVDVFDLGSSSSVP